MEHITIDFFFDLPVTEGGWNGVWLVVDRFSKLVKLIPVKKDMSVERLIRQYMIYVYCNYGLPVSIVSDQDPRFDADLWKGLWSIAGTTLHTEAAKHPQTDGQSERTIQTIKQILRMYLNRSGSNWREWLPLVEFWYNSAIHESTGKSPFEIVQGRNPRNPVNAALEVDWTHSNQKAVEIIDEILRTQALWKVVNPQIAWKGRDESTTRQEREVKTRIKKAQNKFKKYYDIKRRPHNIRKEDWVRVNKKDFPPRYFDNDRKETLNSKYSAPVKVLKVKNGSATLEANQDFGKDTRVNVSRLRKVRFRNDTEREALKDN
jgi:hypothetical protein